MNTVNGPQFFGSVLKAIACTRNHNFDEEAYARGVLEPAGRIRAMMRDVGEGIVSTEQVHETLQLLEQIFQTKRTEPEDRVHYLNEIMARNGLRDLLNKEV